MSNEIAFQYKGETFIIDGRCVYVIDSTTNKVTTHIIADDISVEHSTDE